MTAELIWFLFQIGTLADDTNTLSKRFARKYKKKTTAPVYAYYTSLPGAKSFLFNATIESGSDFPFPLHLTGP